MRRERDGLRRIARRDQDHVLEQGVTLVEMMIALLVLLVVFLATSQLVFTSLGTSSGNSSKEVAESIATGVLSQERQAAFNQGATWFTSSGLPTGTGSAAKWCNSTCTPIVQTIASTGYYVYLTGGWCSESNTGTWQNLATSSSFGTSSNPYPGYFLAIKVAWGPGASQTTQAGVTGINTEDRIVMQGLVTTAGGDSSSAPTSGPISSCPVGALQ
jgi:prepilin-type N-terminal cleavage/methylation domain-containing protein